MDAVTKQTKEDSAKIANVRSGTFPELLLACFSSVSPALITFP